MNSCSKIFLGNSECPIMQYLIWDSYFFRIYRKCSCHACQTANVYELKWWVCKWAISKGLYNVLERLRFSPDWNYYSSNIHWMVSLYILKVGAIVSYYKIPLKQVLVVIFFLYYDLMIIFSLPPSHLQFPSTDFCASLIPTHRMKKFQIWSLEISILYFI